MSSKNSNPNEKTINNLKSDAVSGDGILGGGSSNPQIIILPNSKDIPMDVTGPEVTLPFDPVNLNEAEPLHTTNNGNIDLK